MALAITPQDDFGDLLVLARLQSEGRDRTLARASPIAGLYY